MSSRRRFTAELKARVALEALRGDRKIQKIPDRAASAVRQDNGIEVGRHRVRRLMWLMGLQAMYQALRTSALHPALLVT